MLFLIPFAVMLAIATFFTELVNECFQFVSAGIMAAGTASAIEMGKIKGKQEIKNTIATSGVSYVYSPSFGRLSYPLLVKAPPLLEGGVALLRQYLSGGGGGI